jgi:predicted porin
LERHRSAALTLFVALTTAGSIAAAQTATATQSGAPAAAAPTDSGAKAAAPAAAPAAADSAPNFFKDVQANAFVSFGYLYNFNKTPDQSVGLRYFDNRANNLSIDVAELVLQKTVAKPGDAGFRVDLEAGTAIPGKEQSAGLNIGNGADLQQAFLSYIAPVGAGLRLDMGKFVTHLGYELIEGYDGYNDNYSRSLLFNYAIPLTHTGVKATYAVNSMVSVMAMVVNGWDNSIDNNASKSIGLQLALTPAPPVAIYLNYMGGPEKTDTNSLTRHITDFIATYKVTDQLLLGVNADYGFEQKASVITPGTDAKWYGVAGYVHAGPALGPSIGLRAETFKDQGGTRILAGSPIQATEFTITPTYKFSSNFVLRAEGRYDNTNVAYFTDDKGQPKKNQSTLGINAIFVY